MEQKTFSQLVERYGDLSFKVNKMGEALVEDTLQESLALEQDAFIRFIKKHQPCTSSQLAEVFYVKKSAVTSIVNKLVEKGYIRRTRSRRDRRVVFLRLTEKGTAFHEECQSRVHEVLADLISQFREEEIAAFMNTYEKLAHLLEEQLRLRKGV